MGEPDYPECLPPIWEQYLDDLENFYFREEKKHLGSVMIIEKDGFKHPQNAKAALRNFYLDDEYLNKYGGGDYGSENTSTLIIGEI